MPVNTARKLRGVDVMSPDRIKTHRSGFTLVELLVLVAIVALLFSFLLPALTKAREATIRVQCASNMRQIVLGMQMYAGDFRGWYPPYGFVGRPGCDDGAGGSWWDKTDGTGYALNPIPGGVGYYTAREKRYIT